MSLDPLSSNTDQLTRIKVDPRVVQYYHELDTYYDDEEDEEENE